jgi:hypothetical protein
MKRQIVFVFILFIFLTGCAGAPVYKGGVKPIYPETDWGTTVDSLTPTFRWQSDTPSPCKYDFAIWDVELIKDQYRGNIRRRFGIGTLLYYKEALPLPEHTIEIPLAPDNVYYWSVRFRCEDNVSDWAKVYFIDFYRVGDQISDAILNTTQHYYYMFLTPKTDGK